ncbi:MAG: hypothetical protein QOE69_2624 [Thermoleophilaceae bacterium]|jgi:hypothetical protein|nr:hypothetical protein [Thermoleophilaceae bacterium]
MRKLLVPVLALAAVLAVVGVAFGANTYKVHKAGTTAKGKGSIAKPIPTGIVLGFQVGESDPTKRGTVIEKYAIGAEGIVANPKGAPKCAFDELNDPGPVPAKCNKARVGGGLVKNAAGPSNDQSLSHSSPCNLKLDLYNTGSGMVIHLDSQSKPPPPGGFDSDEVGCLLPIDGRHSINGKFVKTKIAGKPASDFRFTVPENLKHPAPGVDNSIRESVNNILLKTKVVKGKRVGFYNKVGCKGNKRTTRATFTTEQTATAAPATFSATKQSKC